MRRASGGSALLIRGFNLVGDSLPGSRPDLPGPGKKANLSEPRAPSSFVLGLWLTLIDIFLPI
jgi:hypothetical protein